MVNALFQLCIFIDVMSNPFSVYNEARLNSTSVHSQDNVPYVERCLVHNADDR